MALHAGHVCGHHSEKGEGMGGPQHLRKADRSGGEVGTGGRGHKQGTGPGTERPRKAKGYGYSGVARTELVGRDMAYL